jgi:hypothetical protein
VSVEIRTAAELITPERAEEWTRRRAQRDDPVLRAIWQEFIAVGGPVPLAAAARRVPDLARADLRACAEALDTADLIELDGDHVRLAYPFTAGPNDFEVVLPGRRRRFGCCAIDALGVAPMVGLPVTVRSRCHQSGAPLVVDVDPSAGPRSAPPEWLVWIERGRWGGDRLSGFL